MALLMLSNFLSCVALFLCCVGLSYGIHSKYSTTSSGQFSKYVIEEFGLARGAIVNIDYAISISSDYGLSTDVIDNIISQAYIQLLVINQFENDNYYSSIGGTVSPSCDKASFFRQQLTSSGSIAFNISTLTGQDDLYSVLIMQCRTLSGYYGDYPIDIGVTVDMKNPQPSGSSYSHSGIDEVMISRVLEGEIIVYALLMVAMVAQYMFAKPYIKYHHYLFAFALFFQFLFVISLYYGESPSTSMFYDIAFSYAYL
jgi:hypothetical protein